MNIEYTKELKKKFYSRDWKEKNEKYIAELNKFFDIVDNIENEDLKLRIIYQMLICDKILTEIAEEKLGLK